MVNDIRPSTGTVKSRAIAKLACYKLHAEAAEKTDIASGSNQRTHRFPCPPELLRQVAAQEPGRTSD
jgi:hypothetical protein